MDYLPLHHRLQDSPVLLVGGGQVALRKARLLLAAGARLTVLAPVVCAELESLSQPPQLSIHHARYAKHCLRGKHLVVVASGDKALNRSIHRDCKARGLPLNVVDDTALCSVIFPAVIDRSPLLISLSSGGQAPVLARLLRAQLEAAIPHAYGNVAALAGRFRQRVRDTIRHPLLRRRFWEKLLQGPLLQVVQSKPEKEARDYLQQTLAGSDHSAAPSGEVYLVGSGPGDPELLTFKALRLMQQADIVLHDRLVPEPVLALCRRDARRIYVGKECGRRSMAQKTINRLLIRYARTGYRVLRLKGGDPLVFSRAAEEIAALREAAIRYQIVPGVTAASACAALAGIALTDRQCAHSLQLITGHHAPDGASIDFQSLVGKKKTLVFYMPLQDLAALCDKLLQAGQAADTPAALISCAGLPAQRILQNRLDGIAAAQDIQRLNSPALLIIGNVVAAMQQPVEAENHEILLPAWQIRDNNTSRRWPALHSAEKNPHAAGHTTPNNIFPPQRKGA